MNFLSLYTKTQKVFDSTRYKNKEKILLALWEKTILGKTARMINGKVVNLEKGNLVLKESEVARMFSFSISAARKLINKLCELGILLKTKIRHNIFIYSWSEIIFGSRDLAFELAKNQNSQVSEITKENQKVIKSFCPISEVNSNSCKSENDEKHPKGNKVPYLIDIDIKEKDKEERDISSSNSTRVERKEDSLFLAFDFSYGENDEKEQAEEMSLEQIQEKIEKMGIPPYLQRPKQEKKHFSFKKTENTNKKAEEEQQKNSRTRKAIDHFFGYRGLALFAQTITAKGIDKVYSIFKGKTKETPLSSVLNDLEKDDYFKKLGIIDSLKKMAEENKKVKGV